MSFWGILGFESKKIFIRRNIIILSGLFIFLAFLCWDGIGDYKKIEANRKPFQEMERDKVSRHIHYTAYGTRGIRLLYIPCPLSIIFNDSAVFPGMTAHVDTGEALEISNSFKGKDLFSNSNGFMDFAGFMLLISGFLSLIYGWDGTRKPDYLKFIYDISGENYSVAGTHDKRKRCKPGFLITLARIILLNLVFWILCGLNLLWLLINGINVANIFYLVYVLLLTLVITSFVVLGAVIGSLKSSVLQFITMPILYLLMVLVIPWLIHRVVYMEAKKGIISIYEFEYQSFKYMMNLEKRMYDRFGVWNSKDVAPDEIKTMIQSGQDIEYKKMREAELERIEGIVKRIHVYQILSSFFPTTFYISTNKELSSKGFQNFIDFYRYSYDMKQDFIKFYIDRKFYRKLPKSGVEPFIKGNEDLFYGKIQLPKSFLLGLFFSIVYIAVLLVILYRMQIKITKSEEYEKPLIPVRVDFKNANVLLALCKNDQIKGEIFRYYEGQKNASSIKKIPVDFTYHLNGLKGIKANVVLKYLCRFAGVSFEKAVEYLALVGIIDLVSLKLTREEILKIYAVLMAAKEVEHIILNDFFKNEPREFESDLFKLLAALETSGKKILYLSCNMYYPKDKDKIHEEVNGEIETFFIFPLPIDSVTLR